MCVKPHSPDLKRGALATDARGCSLWRTLLERPPPAPESRVRDPLGELVRTRVGVVTCVCVCVCVCVCACVRVCEHSDILTVVRTERSPLGPGAF